MNEPLERWTAVAGYEDDYEVSDCGRVLSTGLVRTNYAAAPRLLSPSKSKYGYCQVCLYSNGKARSHFVHRLVANAFIPNPNSLPEVNHKDGITARNDATNLEWVTALENKKHAKTLPGYGRKLYLGQVLEIKRRLCAGEKPALIAPDYSAGIGTIWAIKHGRIWKHAA